MTNYLEDIRNTLFDARECHGAWWLFTGAHPERDKIVWVHNYYPNFFGVVRPALFVTFVVKLASLFGTRQDEISLKLIPEIEQEESFASLWERGRRLHKYRSKVIAHRDVEVQVRSYAKESGFTHDDLKKVLDDTCKLFDSAARRLGAEPLPSHLDQTTLCRVIRDLYKQRGS